MSSITLKEVGGSIVFNVPDGSTVIGRGSFLQVTDKRVSRSHALLEVTDNKLFIKPTHTNPCFFRPSANSKEQKVLSRDVKHPLNHGDEFGLLPDQLFYQVIYPQVNGNESESVNAEIPKTETEDKKTPSSMKPTEETKKENREEEDAEESDSKLEPVANGDSEKDIEKEEDLDIDENMVAETKLNKTAPLEMKDRGNVPADKDAKPRTPTTPRKKDETGDNDSKEESPGMVHGDMAMPIEKKRILPDWMVKAAVSPVKAKPSPKKPVVAAVNKRPPGGKLTKAHYDDDEDEDYEEEEVYVPKKTKRTARAAQMSDDEEAISDDDYIPEKATASHSRDAGGRRARKKVASESDEDFSEESEDEYAPKRRKATPKPKKGAKGKGKAGGKTRAAPARTPRKTPQKRKKDSDDDVSLPRRGQDDDDDDDEGATTRRPQRAAKAKRGSYVDDPMIEEALEDFASEDDGDDMAEKDSDFEFEGEEDSGSDWEKSKSSSQKQKAPKASRSRIPSRSSSKRASTGKKARRKYDSDDDFMYEDVEPYRPRLSKRRSGLKPDSDESDGEGKKKRRREPCQYGKKCYRKNPVHFRTFCHPGDSSYDEDDKDISGPKGTKKEKESSKASPERPKRPQRSTAGTRLVTQGVDDDDLPDTYDYNDSFIDDGTQPSPSEEEDSAGDDSDYDAEEDVRGVVREAKKFMKNKKLTKPVSSK